MITSGLTLSSKVYSTIVEGVKGTFSPKVLFWASTNLHKWNVYAKVEENYSPTTMRIHLYEYTYKVLKNTDKF